MVAIDIGSKVIYWCRFFTFPENLIYCIYPYVSSLVLVALFSIKKWKVHPKDGVVG
jgi:hypothetical protein